MTILVIGGGWSGLAAAVRLSEQGQHVHLIESAKQLGGRARSVDWQELQIDNGQHLMIGAYHRTLTLLDAIGADAASLFTRRPLDINIHDPAYPNLRIASGQVLPWPLSMAWRLGRDNGLSIVSEVLWLSLKARLFDHNADTSVSHWLHEAKQSERLIRQLWEPLCLATMNTPIENASASVFANVLNDTFRRRHDTDLLIPKVALGQLLPDHAETYIRQHGGQISLQTRVRHLSVSHGKVIGAVTDKGDLINAEQVILATPAMVSRQLLASHVSVPVFDSHPIATVYLQYAPEVRLPQPVIGLSGTLGQWLFERSDLRPGLVTVVISGPGEHEKLNKQALIAAVSSEISTLLPTFPPRAVDALVIREKKATFACNVDIQRQRPNNRTEITGLWLAGDFVANPYPATLEGAILNGERTAIQLMEQLRASR